MSDAMSLEERALQLDRWIKQHYGTPEHYTAYYEILAAIHAATEHGEREVRGVLDALGVDALLVRENGGPENIYASLSASVAQLQRKRTSAETGHSGGKWLVWSLEHDAWWATDERGYRNNIDLAGRYTRARAEEIVRNANRGRAQPNETMVPAPEAT